MRAVSDDRLPSPAPRIHVMDGAPLDALSGAILCSLPNALFVKDREQRFVVVNERFLELAGCPAEMVLGRLESEIVGAQAAERYLASDREVFETGRTVCVERSPFVDRHARRHVLSTVKVPLRDASGRITHVLGVVDDVTRTKDAEDALRLANEELERRVEERTLALRGAQQELLRKERLAVLGQLAGGLAHQIRNPLAAMSNAASVLKRKIGEHGDPDVQQSLAVILEEIWEANRIITDLIDYARVKPPSLEVVPVGALIDAALGLARVPDDVRVERLVDTALAAWVDERQMRDALGNVLRNAVEAMPGGGMLRIAADAVANDIVITIEDTGPGLTRESLAYLFEPLVTSKSLGLGLGLPTAKALIENQGGTIRCSMTGEVGARFEIHVPRARA
jgi:PAS domain S-box-containing protein